MSAVPLRRLQQWFGAVVEHSGTAAEAFADPAVRRLLPRATPDRVLQPNPRMSSAAMLDVYNGGYLARLVEVLQGDYPALQHLLGEAAFRTLAAAYLQQHPSRHPNLNQLGNDLPGFVRARRRLPERVFAAELATLELAVTRAFDAAEFTPLSPEALQQVPAERWERTAFVPNPSLQLLTFRYPVDVFYQAWKEQGDAAPRAVPAQSTGHLLVHRREDRVWRQRLARGQFRVLQALATGEPLAEALAKAPAGAPVGEWFAQAANEGWFVRLRTVRVVAPKSRRR